MKNGVPEIGDVWWMSLEPVVGHEQGGSYPRPVVVLSHDEHNGPAQRIVAVPCTSKIRGFSTEIPVSALSKPCVALIDQITTLDWVARTELAALASDTWGCEVRPNNTEGGINQPWHWITIPIMGMTMGEIFYLKDLAEDCADDHVYEFMFVAPAIPITGAVGSPTNPLAIK